MILGYDAKRLFNNFTGLGNYSRSLLTNLQKYFPENDYRLYTPRTNTRAETEFFLTNKNYKIIQPSGGLKGFWRSYGINKNLEEDKIDLYHGLSHELPFGSSKGKFKTIVTIHDLIFKVYPKTYPALDRFTYDLKFRYACENSDKLVAISESTKKDIVELYNIDPEKISVLYQSCNPIYYSQQSSEQIEQALDKYNLPSNFILSVGSVEERKNLKVLIEAYSKLPKNLQLPIVIVGKGTKYKTEVEGLITKKKLESNVVWINQLSDNHHLQALYQKAVVLVYPSLYEGFGLPVAEALLSSTPVITSNVSSLPEAAGSDQILIDPKNSDELCHALERVLSDENLRRKMAEKGLAYARVNFSAELVTKQQMQIYTECLSK